MADQVRLEAVPADGMPKATALRPAVTTASLTNDPKRPDYRCAFHVDQMPRWCMIEALMGGTESMRAAGETYLPRFSSEHLDNWRQRLERAVLLNYFRKTVVGYTGKPFGKPLIIPMKEEEEPEEKPVVKPMVKTADDAEPEVDPDDVGTPVTLEPEGEESAEVEDPKVEEPEEKEEGLPKSILKTLEDVDDCGTNFDVFAQRGFQVGVAKGIVHAYIDYPEAKEGATAEDEAKQHPIVTLIQPEQLIGARHDSDGQLTQIRIYECCYEPDGAFGEKKVERVRVIEQDTWTVYRKDEKAKRWSVDNSGVNSLGEIPLATFRTDEEGFMRSRPPLLDLAYKNIEHWQSSSDQRNCLTVARFPMLVGAGVNPQDPIVIGPNNYVGLRDPAAKLSFVEHGGAAIGAGRNDMEDLKAEMAVLGLTLLLPQQSGAPTATAKAVDGAESVTELQRLVGLYENFLNEVVYWIARWQMEEADAFELPKVRINQDYAKLLNMEAGIQALLAARAGKDISRAAFIDALKRRNILPQDFDTARDEEKLDEEKASAPALPEAVPSRFGFGRPPFGKPAPKPGEEADPTTRKPVPPAFK